MDKIEKRPWEGEVLGLGRKGGCQESLSPCSQLGYGWHCLQVNQPQFALIKVAHYFHFVDPLKDWQEDLVFYLIVVRISGLFLY